MAAYQAPPSLGFSNTGVGCHFLLQCMKVKSESEIAQSCPNLCDPMDCSLPGSSIHEIFQARVLEWGAIAFSEFLNSTSFKCWERLKVEGERMTEDEMVGWHHWLNGHESVWILGVGDRQGGLACCGSWVAKSWTRLSDWTELKWRDILLL